MEQNQQGHRPRLQKVGDNFEGWNPSCCCSGAIPGAQGHTVPGAKPKSPACKAHVSLLSISEKARGDLGCGIGGMGEEGK